jgi:C-terminal processing protease CtpA/Prc
MTIHNRVIAVMKFSRSDLKPCFSVFLGALMLLGSLPLLAADAEDADRQRLTEAQREELLQQREAMMAAIEKSRQEVERVAQEARMKAETLREETERLRADSAELARESAEARRAASAELAREREELSRTHRELRRASQEVARAHRELTLAEDREIRMRTINLGDRAMMGVILGEQTKEGIKIIGVSPDGPAERAGIETGDVLTSLRGESLTSSAENPPRETIYEVMSEVGDGEEISVEVLRGDERMQFMIKPEKREPASWASYIRLPDPVVAPSPPGAVSSFTVAPHVRIEQIAVPSVDTAGIVAEAAALAEELEAFHITVHTDDGEAMEYSYQFPLDTSYFELNTEAFSEFGAMAMDEARLWFGAGATLGMQFADINEGLAGYFGTDSGVLVLDAPDDNAFGLVPGDVVLKVGDSDINGTSDFVRALRDHRTGEEVEITIKRDKRDVSFGVVIPENRFGLFHENFANDTIHATISTEVTED